MPDSDPKQDNARDTPNLPAVVQEGEVLRPAADNWPVSYTHLTLPTNREV